jgi:outer membrane protein OmpA-like peptidoglycan-associated protein
VALVAGTLVVLLFVTGASFVRTGQFGLSSDLATSSVQSDLDDITLNGTNAFILDQSTVLEAADAELDRAAEILASRPDLDIAVIGHARVDGDEEFDNVRLSERRALNIIDELVERGIRFERLIPVAMGSEESKSREMASEELVHDQRVELTVVRQVGS